MESQRPGEEPGCSRLSLLFHRGGSTSRREGNEMSTLAWPGFLLQCSRPTPGTPEEGWVFHFYTSEINLKKKEMNLTS